MSQQQQQQSENSNQQQQKSTKQIRFFFNNEFLSDFKLNDKTQQKSYNLHKILLASRSNYFFEQFEKNKELKELDLPQFIQSTFQKNEFSSEILEAILKSYYGSHLTPLEGFIHAGLESHNCFLFYSVAHSLQMHETQNLIQNYILEKFKNEFEQVFGVLKDAIKFQNKAIADMARELICFKFQKVCDQKSLEAQVLEVPYYEFLSLVKSEKLNVKNETQIFQLVINYIANKEKLEENKDWDYTNGQAKENDDNNKDKEQQKDQIQEQKQQEQKQGEQQNEQQQSDIEIQAQEKLKLYKLTPLQKIDLLEAVKLSFVNNEDLLMASQKEEFSQFKDVFLKAISAKLKQVENPGNILPSDARESYRESIIQNQSQLIKSRQYLQNQSMLPTQNNQQQQQQEYLDVNNSKNNLSTHQQQYQVQVQNSNNNIDQNNISGVQKRSQYQNFNRQQQNQSQQDIEYSWVQNKNSYQVLSTQGNTNGYKKQIVLKYERDFDTNGVFYYLGTCGKTKSYQNPHETGQCKVLFSSLRTGRLQDFVSREVTNLSTNNEKNSYMGVDLGNDRYLFPTCYTIRNRNSTTHVMFNWCLEGSINGEDWYVLDKRINFSETNQRFNQMMENERQMLITRGASTTWGVDTTALKKFFEKNFQKEKGFRMFKITQLFENSHGSDNLCLSGLELYGNCYGEKWYNISE